MAKALKELSTNVTLHSVILLDSQRYSSSFFVLLQLNSAVRSAGQIGSDLHIYTVSISWSCLPEAEMSSSRGLVILRPHIYFMFKRAVFRPDRRWQKCHHLKQFVRFHTDPSGRYVTFSPPHHLETLWCWNQLSLHTCPVRAPCVPARDGVFPSCALTSVL